MYTQNNIVLSIGTNVGDKIDNINKAIDLIHKKIGTVIKVSSIYEFPAWGFESDVFYNCAILIHSYLTPEQAIKNILEAEIELGRIRDNNIQGYQARSIDIDIITFNDEIIEQEKLTIPHPLMHQRAFVLQPMLDLNLDWTHPVLAKNISELLINLQEQKSQKVICPPRSLLDKIGLKNINFIAIEGNIGAGKTTLTNRISEDFNAKMILEGFADNPFLPKFYKDTARYAFPLEMSFLADRYNQLSEDLAQFDLFKEFIISDYYIFKSLIFAQITLEPDEFNLYKQIFEIMYKDTPSPDIYVYLYQNTSRLLENIALRGRSYESDITATYLDKVNKSYFNFIKTLPANKVILIDISDLDFVKNQEDYINILEQIKNKLHS